jgi:hypothetical protein
VEVRLLRRAAYDRSGARNVLESLMIEGFLWLHETLHA